MGIYFLTAQSFHFKMIGGVVDPISGASFRVQTVLWSPSIWIASDQTQQSCVMENLSLVTRVRKHTQKAS